MQMQAQTQVKSSEPKERHKRTWLKDSVTKQCLPALTRLGFTQHRLDKSFSAEERFVLPWASFTRARADGDVDLVLIRLSKRGLAECSICFGVIPAAGVMVEGRHFPPEHCWPGWGNRVEYDLLPYKPGFFSFDIPSFRVRLWPWQIPQESDYEKLVQQMTSYLPELDAALSHGTIGPHIRKIPAFPVPTLKSEEASS